MSYTKSNKSCELLNNKNNLGFVKTTNRGLRLKPTHDVILLNTDTIVTKGWVEKIQYCAYSEKKIATVTPLTNNGDSLCSVPTFGVANEVPHGFTVDSFAEIVEQASKNEYPSLPSAVGFCMFIKRSVIKEIGVFDENKFGRGYGEETELSRRAIGHGYRCAVDTATYIYHTGGASFDKLNMKMEKIRKEHLELLNRLHPEYLVEWHSFFMNNPLRPVHKRIKFLMICSRLKIPINITAKMYNFYCSFQKWNMHDSSLSGIA